MLQNVRVTAFTVSELLREKQQGGGIILPPPSPPRLGLSDCKNLLFQLIRFYSFFPNHRYIHKDNHLFATIKETYCYHG